MKPDLGQKTHKHKTACLKLRLSRLELRGLRRSPPKMQSFHQLRFRTAFLEKKKNCSSPKQRAPKRTVLGSALTLTLGVKVKATGLRAGPWEPVEEELNPGESHEVLPTVGSRCLGLPFILICPPGTCTAHPLLRRNRKARGIGQGGGQLEKCLQQHAFRHGTPDT